MVCRFVKRSMHGTRMMSTGEIHEVYGRELVVLRNESRWTFLNTLFSVSEAVMYAQVHSMPFFAARKAFLLLHYMQATHLGLFLLPVCQMWHSTFQSFLKRFLKNAIACISACSC